MSDVNIHEDDCEVHDVDDSDNDNDYKAGNICYILHENHVSL